MPCAHPTGPSSWRSTAADGSARRISSANTSPVAGASSHRGLTQVDLDESERQLLEDHRASWLLREELLNFNYDAALEIRARGPAGLSSNESRKTGQGRLTTWREYIGPRDVDIVLTRLR